MHHIIKMVKLGYSHHPIFVNSLIYGTLYVAAEFSQQTIGRRITKTASGPYDTVNLLRLGVYGTTIQGPLLTVWYRWLDKKFIGTSLRTVGKKMFIDQFLMTPPLLVVFYVTMSIMENKKDLLHECREKFVVTYKTSCFFWLPAQAVNFLFIPSALRVTYVGACAFAWVNILCWFKKQEF